MQRIQKSGVAASLPVLENFVATYPNSPWLPSLQANLGRYYEGHGLYAKALRQWEAAWAATHNEQSAPGKQIADFTLVYWTRLLAGLGRVDALGALLQETEGRTLDRGPLSKFSTTPAANTGSCARGPTPASAAARSPWPVSPARFGGSAFNPGVLTRIPAPVTGFSMSRLVGLAHRVDLDLVAARWDDQKTLVVPSVVHWKDDHYAAILAERNGSYQVKDPLFTKARWLRLDDIREEASGSFIVPKDKLPQGWTLLDRAETDRIFGRGWVGGATDPTDGCGNGSGGGDPPGVGPGGSGLGGGGGPILAEALRVGPRRDRQLRDSRLVRRLRQPQGRQFHRRWRQRLLLWWRRRRGLQLRG